MGRNAVGANTIDCDGYHVPDSVPPAFKVNRLEIGRTSDELALMTARFLDENIEPSAHAGRVEGCLLPVKHVLKGRKPTGLDIVADLQCHFGGGCPGAGRIFEGEGARIFDFTHKIEVNGPQELNRLDLNRGPTPFHIQHTFSSDVLYEIPARYFAGNRFAKAFLGGWQAGSILTMQTGFPFSVTNNQDTANVGEAGYQRPNGP